MIVKVASTIETVEAIQFNSERVEAAKKTLPETGQNGILSFSACRTTPATVSATHAAEPNETSCSRFGYGRNREEFPRVS